MSSRKVLILIIAAVAMLSSCSITRHVPDGQYLLDDVKIVVDDNETIKQADLINYLRQQPNHEVLGGMKLQLMVYNISGRDSTSRFNRWIRRIGSAPVVYDHVLTDASVTQLTKALQNRGYLHSHVTADTFARPDKKKIKVQYNVTTNSPHYISSIAYNIPNDTIRDIIMADSASFLIKPDEHFDRNVLEQERQRITARLRDHGYYAFNKEYITFNADTAYGERSVNLVLNVMPPYRNDKMPFYDKHRPFYVRNVKFITNYDPIEMHDPNSFNATDSIRYNGIDILYGDDKYIRPSVIDENCFITPGSVYKASNTDKTYESLSRLGIIKFVNISYSVVGEIDGAVWLDATVLLTKGKSQNVSLSLEGTNSEGDLGFGVGTSYQHRNIGHGAEVLTTKFKASYESLSGNISGLINDNYQEYSGDVSIMFPKFKFPFLKKSFKQKVLATTELTTTFSYQERPEYTRIIAGAGWKYHWTNKNNMTRHVLDLVDLNYVYLPKSRSNFLDSISNPLLRYSYEDHFILRAGYVYYHTNKLPSNGYRQRFQSDFYTFRAGVETAGNFLYGMSKLFGQKKRDDGSYRVFDINYSQYIKGEIDYTYTHRFSPRHMVAFHSGFGIGIPYGNSTILPFEKRFYAGGANGVRGWSVRTLGPGAFRGNNSVTNFINQCGDIRLDFNMEYRAKLFWVLELGAFIDAGNIWTIKEYDNQPDGVFKFDKFYKQIALAYGLGLRFDFTYFLIRLDLGMKAHNPAKGEEPWPIFHPNWSRDSAIHFSVGYPF